jgi:hypothetical protein
MDRSLFHVKCVVLIPNPMCHLKCFVKDYGEDKIIDLARCRRQRKQETSGVNVTEKCR